MFVYKFRICVCLQVQNLCLFSKLRILICLQSFKLLFVHKVQIFCLFTKFRIVVCLQSFAFVFVYKVQYLYLLKKFSIFILLKKFGLFVCLQSLEFVFVHKVQNLCLFTSSEFLFVNKFILWFAYKVARAEVLIWATVQREVILCFIQSPFESLGAILKAEKESIGEPRGRRRPWYCSLILRNLNKTGFKILFVKIVIHISRVLNRTRLQHVTFRHKSSKICVVQLEAARSDQSALQVGDQRRWSLFHMRRMIIRRNHDGERRPKESSRVLKKEDDTRRSHQVESIHSVRSIRRRSIRTSG